MKWIVGLDLRPSSQGAIRFAHWLSKNSKARGGEHLVGIHVLEEEHLRAVLRYHHLDEVISSARQAAQSVVETVGADKTLRDVEIVQGVHAEKSLEAARVYHHADALIVGRQANRDGHAMIRLGRVARRLLRSLPAPVMIVPPDLDQELVGKGPIVAMTDLTANSAPACRFAKDMADRLGRELLVVHVVPLPEEYGVQYLPNASLEKLRAEHQETGREQLAAWVAQQGLDHAQTCLLQGQVVHHVLDLAKERDAAMVVCGSRRLTMFERMLLTSIGSELAALASCAVAVVSPESEDGG